MKTLEETREFFKADRWANTLGAKIITIDENYAKCEVLIEDKHLNGANTVMGGALYTLADFTCAVASNLQERLSVTVDGHINYLAAGRSGKLIAEAFCQKNGKTIGTYEVKITDETGKLIATADFNVINL